LEDKELNIETDNEVIKRLASFLTIGERYSINLEYWRRK